MKAVPLGPLSGELERAKPATISITFISSNSVAVKLPEHVVYMMNGVELWRHQVGLDQTKDIPSTFTFLGTRMQIPDIWEQAAEVFGPQIIEGSVRKSHVDGHSRCWFFLRQWLARHWDVSSLPCVH